MNNKFFWEAKLEVAKFLSQVRDAISATNVPKDTCTTLDDESIELWEPNSNTSLHHIIMFKIDDQCFRVFFTFYLHNEQHTHTQTIRERMENNFNLDESPHNLYSYLNHYWISFQQGKSIDPHDGKTNNILFEADAAPHWKKVSIFPHHHHLYINNTKQKENHPFAGNLEGLLQLISHHAQIEISNPSVDIEEITASIKRKFA